MDYKELRVRIKANPDLQVWAQNGRFAAIADALNANGTRALEPVERDEITDYHVAYAVALGDRNRAHGLGWPNWADEGAQDAPKDGE